MTLLGSLRDEHIVASSWAVYCGSHSDPDVGVHVFACGVPKPYHSACLSACLCEIADRCLVVDATRADLRWWHCADVLICQPQSCLSDASRATSTALIRLPGCTLAVASHRAPGCVLRTREGPVLVSRPVVRPALLAAYAHLNQLRGGAM